MSVTNPVVERFELPTRTAWLFGGVTSFHPIDDVYEEYAHARAANDYFLQHDYVFFETKGGDFKNPDGSKRVDRYLQLNRGAKIVFQDGSEYIESLGEMISDDGSSPVDTTNITGVKIYTPYVAKTEIITNTINTGSGLTNEQNTILESIKTVVDWILGWAKSDEQKDAVNSKYFRKDPETEEVILEKDFTDDGNGGWTLKDP